MKMDINRFRGKIIEKGLNVERLADEIGMDKASLYRRINDFEKFTIGDLIKIKDVLGMDDREAYEIFFG